MTTGKTFLIVYKRHLLSDNGSHFAVWRRALEKSFEAVTDVANSGNKWALTGERLSILLRLRRSKRWKTERGSCFRHKWWPYKDIWGEWASVKIKNARSWGSVTNKNYIFPGYLALFRENLSPVPFTLCIFLFFSFFPTLLPNCTFYKSFISFISPKVFKLLHKLWNFWF